MNNLNSLVLEGTLEGNATMNDKTANAIIAVNCSYINSKCEEVTETSHFTIEAYSKLADLLLKFGKSGRGIRLVGKLKQVNDSIIIVTEHIEFKPDSNN